MTHTRNESKIFRDLCTAQDKAADHITSFAGSTKVQDLLTKSRQDMVSGKSSAMFTAAG